MQATQPKAREALTTSHGASATPILMDRVRKQLDDRGTLDVLRHGVELIGLKHPLALAQFRPALAMNADIVARCLPIGWLTCERRGRFLRADCPPAGRSIRSPARIRRDR
jgi:hypothetical protein